MAVGFAQGDELTKRKKDVDKKTAEAERLKDARHDMLRKLRTEQVIFPLCFYASAPRSLRFSAVV